MKTKDEFIKEISHHAFIEIIETGAMDYVKQAMDNFAIYRNKELIDNIDKLQDERDQLCAERDDLLIEKEEFRTQNQ